MKLSTYLLIAFLFCISGIAIAQDTVISNADFIQLLISSLGGIKGASAMAIAAIVVKLLLAAFNSELLGKQLDKLTGKAKLSVISFLSYASGVLALTAADVSLGAALIHSAVVPLLVVFLNQVWKQFVEKKNEPAKANK